MTAPRFFVSDTRGELLDYDTLRPVRSNYSRHHATIRTGQDFRASLREGPYAWPGGYALSFICSDGAPLCFSCARENARLVIGSIRGTANDGWRVVGLEPVQILEDGEEFPAVCEHCSLPIDPSERD